jgi:hypothetical protein
VANRAGRGMTERDDAERDSELAAWLAGIFGPIM